MLLNTLNWWEQVIDFTRIGGQPRFHGQSLFSWTHHGVEALTVVVQVLVHSVLLAAAAHDGWLHRKRLEAAVG